MLPQQIHIKHWQYTHTHTYYSVILSPAVSMFSHADSIYFSMSLAYWWRAGSMFTDHRGQYTHTHAYDGQTVLPHVGRSMREHQREFSLTTLSPFNCRDNANVACATETASLLVLGEQSPRPVISKLLKGAEKVTQQKSGKNDFSKWGVDDSFNDVALKVSN